MKWIELEDIKKMGGKYTIGSPIKKRVYGTIYEAELQIGEKKLTAEILRSWLCSQKVIKAIDSNNEDQIVFIEDQFEEYLNSNEEALKQFSRSYMLEILKALLQLIGFGLFIFCLVMEYKTKNPIYSYIVIAYGLVCVTSLIIRYILYSRKDT